MSDLYSRSNSTTDSNAKIMVGLDIGTTKICALVASVEQESKNMRILGIGISESEGLSRGVVVNIEKTTKAIKNVVEQAEMQSGVKINEVNIGIAGDHIESIQSRGIITISSPTAEISRNDVERLLDEARKINIPSDRKILHVLPQDFIVDGQEGVQDPVGMSGLRLEANVHIITGLSTAINNITRCVERAGLKIKNLVLEPLASANAVISDEEREVGVAVIDIGGGTTDIAVFADKIIRYTSVFGIAGNQITGDLQQGLGITLANAEKVKREHGHTYEPSILHDEPIMVPGISGRKPQEISKYMLCRILQPRVSEIFALVYAELEASGYLNRLGAGIVITGGSTLLRGIDELAQELLQMPVRVGIPTGITYAGLAPEIESPVYSTAVGLALWNIDENNENELAGSSTDKEITDERDIKSKPYKLPETQKQINNTKASDKDNNDKKQTKPASSWLKKLTDIVKEL
ncbi:MAG: cell division protein FtsA [Candidatus Kapaibacterium sp.]|jgi:cell division protein FtsA|nr:cell division protein FtsA [Candidatus Kapabacteria bacterium]